MNKLLFAFSIPCLAGTLTLAPPVSPRAGTTAIWTVTLASGGGPAGLQWTFSCDHTVGTITMAPAGTALAAQKVATSNSSGSVVTVGSGTLNTTPIADGLVANISVALPTALANTNLTCTIQGGTLPALGASTPPTIAVVETPNPPVSVSVLPSISLCDINGDGQTNQSDVTAELNAVMAQTAGFDRNGDGKTDVVDLEIVIAAATGAACTASQ